ncbi:MAG TPA: D-alanyl-D-alanine carboxypeptidase family protein [Thermoleophilaceae bacterium]
MRAARLTVLLALALCAAAGPASAATPAPQVPQAKTAIVVDGRTGALMWARDANARRSMASTTKLMTALLTLERARPGQVFTSPGYDPLPAESQIHLAAGERMTVADLLRALLLESANDAAVTLADGISGSTPAFVAQMNERARQLGLDDTSYANPIGLDDPANYSSAQDLAALAVRLLRKPRFARIVNRPQATLRSGAHERVIDNRNDLVGSYSWVDGVKTGHTNTAGYLLVGAAHGVGGARVVSVVMGEPSEAARDAETLALLQWGLGRFARRTVLRHDRPVASTAIEYRDERARLVPARATAVTVRAGERVSRRVQAPAELAGPLAAGRRVGSVTVRVDGRPVRRVALVTQTAVPAAGTLRVLTSVLGVPLTCVLVLAILIVAGLAALRLRVRMRLVRR